MLESSYTNLKKPAWLRIPPIDLPANRPFNWKVFLFLVLLIVPACFAALPYTLQLQSITVTRDELPIFMMIVLRSAAIYSLLAGIGLFLASRLGLGLPFIEGWFNDKSPLRYFRSAISQAAIVGVVASVVILLLSILVFKPLLQMEMAKLGISIPEEIKPLPWQGFLASFYGGIVEEVQMRLFLMTLLAWLGRFVSRDEHNRPTSSIIWIANITAAALFGLAHLPSTAAIGLPMSPLVITRALVLNGIGGIAFGWLYWKRGLESSIIAHFTADICVHVITPIAIGLLLST